MDGLWPRDGSSSGLAVQRWLRAGGFRVGEWMHLCEILHDEAARTCPLYSSPAALMAAQREAQRQLQARQGQAELDRARGPVIAWAVATGEVRDWLMDAVMPGLVSELAAQGQTSHTPRGSWSSWSSSSSLISATASASASSTALRFCRGHTEGTRRVCAASGS